MVRLTRRDELAGAEHVLSNYCIAGAWQIATELVVARFAESAILDGYIDLSQARRPWWARRQSDQAMT